MPQVVIDGKKVAVSEGATVLEAAAAAGVEIPTLCHRPGLPAQPSCMVCAVREVATGRFVPSCASRVAEGQEFESETEDVYAFRRQALELLLGEHVGDCEAPCRLACPAGYPIPQLLRQLAAGGTIFQPAACVDCDGRCERACRRGRQDAPVAIRSLFLGGETNGSEFAAESDFGFNCRLGKLQEGELESLLRFANPASENLADPAAEAARCLHCDCRAAEDCELRRLAELYGASYRRRRGDVRRTLEIEAVTPELVFEPGKCIRCGICIGLCEEQGIEPGLTFLHRGSEVRVAPPIGESWESALGASAAMVAQACPTGALSLRED